MDPRLTFPPSRRLGHDLEFQRVYDARMRQSRAGLLAHSAPSQHPHYRLGLSVGKSVGGAVERHRVKRLLREAFRMAQHDLPRPAQGGYDLVLGVRGRADGLTLEAASRSLIELTALLHHAWQKRSAPGRGVAP